MNEIDIKIQAEQTTHRDADRRGDKRLGKDTTPVSRHATILEARVSGDKAAEAIAAANELNERFNDFIRKYDLRFADKIGGALLGGEGDILVNANVYDAD